VDPSQNLGNDEEIQLLGRCAEGFSALREQLGRVVIGQQTVVEALLVTLLARGHALLVGVPGLAKTRLVSSLARSMGMSFGRVQFTPDLLPADITGTDVMNEVELGGGRVRREIEFIRGPIFANLVLADEVNRTPPKTQAALLQAMQEHEVTSGVMTHPLPDPFQVFATRNPIEQEGTYPLPEAQLDRFLLEVHVDYPSFSEEQLIAERTSSGMLEVPTPVLSVDQVRAFGALVPKIPVTEEAVRLAVRLTRATRPGGEDAPEEVGRYVRFGAGPRGSQGLVLAAKARAALKGEAAADIDDVLALSIACLRHRLVLGYRAESDGVSQVDVLTLVARKLGVTLPKA
jgi:MoxR-like ATPase